ncbi:MAG: YncE family protein, partial [Mycobacterium sp.]
MTDGVDRVTVIGQVFVGRGPIVDMSVSSRSGMVFVTNQTDDSVSQLDLDTLVVVATVTDTNEPFVVKTAGSRAFVSTASAAYDAVTVIDTDSGGVVATFPLAASIRDLALSPDGCLIYVARTTGDGADVAVIDTISGAITTVDLGTRRGSTAAVITISRDGAWVYVVTADHLGSELVAIDTRDDRV